ncbi:MAG: tetratricopeptide repeat protein [Planctomycetota bacterium]
MRRPAFALASWLLLLVPGQAAPQNQPDPALEAYQFASGLYGEKLYELAAKEYERYLERFDDHEKVPDALLRLGDCYLELGVYDKSVRTLERLTQRHSRFKDLPEALYRLGRSRLELGQLDAAAKAFAEIGERYERHELAAPALYWQGEALFRSDAHEEAAKVLSRFVERHSDSPFQTFGRFTLGWAYFRTDQLEKAAEAFRAVLSDRDHAELHAEARYLLAESLYRRNQLEEALREYAKVPEDSDYGEAAQAGRAWSYSQLERHADASLAFASLAEAHPDSEEIGTYQLQAGISAYRAADYDRALSLLEQRRGSKLPEAEAAYWRGQSLLKSQRAEPALEEFSRVARGNPSDELAVRGWIGAGDALFELKRFEEAARSYDRAADRSPDEELKAYALHASSLCFQRLGRPEEAVKRADLLLASGGPGSWQAEAAFAKAEGLFEAGQYDVAASTYARVAEESTDAERKRAATYKLGWSRFRQEAWEPAREAFTRAADLYTDRPEGDESRFLAAQCALRLGDLDTADRELRQLDRRGGDFADEARLERARLFDQQDRPDDALKLYSQTLEKGGTDQTLALALYEQAGLAARTGRSDLARSSFERLIRDHSQFDELVALSRHGLGWALIEAGESERAIESVTPILSDKKSREDLVEGSLRLVGAAYRQMGQPEKAIGAFEELVKRFPKGRSALEARFGIGVCQATAGDARSASRTLSRLASEELPSELADKVLYELAHAYDAMKDPKSALATRQKLVQTCPSSELVSETLFRMGESSYGENDFGSAADIYLKVATESSGELQEKALYKLGWSRRQAKSHTAAAEAFLNLGSRFPDSELAGEAFYLAGDSLVQVEAYQEATVPFEALLQRFPKHELVPRALFEMGRCEAKRERWDEALECLTRHARQYGESEHAFEASFWIGRCQEAKGRFPSAIQSYQRVTELSQGPTAAEAQLRIGECYAKQKDLDRAIAEMLKVKFLYGHPEWVAEASLRAAELFVAREQPDRARKLIQDVVKEGPSDAAWMARAQQRLTELNER